MLVATVVYERSLWLPRSRRWMRVVAFKIIPLRKSKRVFSKVSGAGSED